MKLIISFINSKKEFADLDKLFGIFDTKTETIEWIKFQSFESELKNVTHALGMCYNNNHWYGALIAREHRLASKIVSIDLKTGEKNASPLLLTKAIHGICRYASWADKQIILANSTQNDLITAITFQNGKAISEDVYYDFLKRYRPSVKLEREYEYDDNYHVNSLFNCDGRIMFSAFVDPSENMPPKIKKIHHMLHESGEALGSTGFVSDNFGTYCNHKMRMPHTVYMNSNRERMCCESEGFRLWNLSIGKYADLPGYARGICEDEAQMGYWVGLSAYRKYSATNGWVKKYPGDEPLKGAMLQFVDYGFIRGKKLDLSKHGQEIFDIIPYSSGGNYGE